MWTDSRSSPLHIAIAGAGITGRTLAWEAVRSGHRVTLVDAAGDSGRTAQPGASWVAAGMLTPNTEAEVSPGLLAMGLEALALWPGLAASLELSDSLVRGGCWVVAHPRDRGELELFESRLRRLGVERGTGYRALTGRELAAGGPALTPFESALYFPDEACIDPALVLGRLRERLLAAGCDWRDGTRVETVDARRLRTRAGDIDADVVVDCRGLGAARQLRGLRGVRGELVEVIAPEVTLDALVRLMHPRYPLYIVPRAGRRYVIGATQIESDDSGPVSVRSALELLSAAYSVHPAFAEGRIVAMRAGCRPALADNHPRIGWYDSGALFVNGLYRHGVLLAPLMARDAMAAITAHVSQEETLPS